MNLPSALSTYFAADRGSDDHALTQAFATDAVVNDEGQPHSGHDAIRAWWRAAKARYHHVAEPLESTTDGNTVTVRCRVSGDFPNSPAMLDFAFTLAGDQIATLEIH